VNLLLKFRLAGPLDLSEVRVNLLAGVGDSSVGDSSDWPAASATTTSADVRPWLRRAAICFTT